MEEIQVVELFAGAGGLALGLENAGLKTIFLNDFDKDAVSTLEKNRPKWKVVLGDIKDISFSGKSIQHPPGGTSSIIFFSGFRIFSPF